jgi:glutaredoxin
MWLLSGLLAAILLVAGGVSAYRAVASFTHAAIAGEPALPVVAAAAAAAAPAEASAGEAAVVEAPAPAQAEPSAHRGESIALAEALPSAMAAELPTAEPAQPPPSLPVQPVQPPPTQAELQAAYSATPIVIYSASWCGVCRQAKRFLSENGLHYREIDADEIPGTWDEIERMTGRRGVPVIIVDGERTPSGLSPGNIMRAVSRSMERRLGVSGIRVRAT